MGKTFVFWGEHLLELQAPSLATCPASSEGGVTAPSGLCTVCLRRRANCPNTLTLDLSVYKYTSRSCTGQMPRARQWRAISHPQLRALEDAANTFPIRPAVCENEQYVRQCRTARPREHTSALNTSTPGTSGAASIPWTARVTVSHSKYEGRPRGGRLRTFGINRFAGTPPALGEIEGKGAEVQFRFLTRAGLSWIAPSSRCPSGRPRRLAMPLFVAPSLAPRADAWGSDYRRSMTVAVLISRDRIKRSGPLRRTVGHVGEPHVGYLGNGDGCAAFIG